MDKTKRGFIKHLRHLGRTMTAAEAAREFDPEFSRQYIHAVAKEYGIKFKDQQFAKKPERCRKCDFRSNGSTSCLRCKWTPTRVRRLRERIGLSQVDMSLKIGMNVWAFARWENRYNRPSRTSLAKLEKAERRRRP